MTPSSPHHSARSFPAALTSPCVRQKNIKTLAGHRLIPPNQMKTMVDSRKNRVFTSKNWELNLINGDSSGWFHQTKKRDNFTPSIDVKIGIWPMKNGSWAVGIIFPRAWPHDGYDGKPEAFHGSKSKFPYQNGHEWGDKYIMFKHNDIKFLHHKVILPLHRCYQMFYSWFAGYNML